jgi:hypothetical protein
MELSQNLTEEELLLMVGIMQANLHLASKNIQKLLSENKELEKRLAMLGGVDNKKEI